MVKKKKVKSTSIAGSLPTNKKETSPDRLNTLVKNTQTTSSSKRSPAESTSKGKSSTGFWKKVTKGWSQKLWLPTKTGCVESPGTTLNGSLDSTESISWSTVTKTTAPNQNSLMTSCPSSSPSSTFSLVDTTVSGGEVERKIYLNQRQKTLQSQENKTHARLKKKNPERVKTIIAPPGNNYIPSNLTVKLKPTQRQKRTINDWFASYRKTWNLSVQSVRQGNDCNEISLRNQFVIKKNMSEENIDRLGWMFRTGKRIREYGVKDYKQIKSFNIG